MWSPYESYISTLVNVNAPSTFMKHNIPITGMMSSKEQFGGIMPYEQNQLIQNQEKISANIKRLNDTHVSMDDNKYDPLSRQGYLRPRNTLYDASQEDSTMLLNQQTTIMTIGMISTAALIIFGISMRG